MGQYKEGWYRNSYGGLFYYDGTEKGDKGKDVVVGKKKVHVKNGQELSEAMIESGKFKKGMREKYREGAKEINREIDEKKKGQFNEYLDLKDKYNGTNGVSDDWYIEEARKLNIDDETIANEIYKKHNGAQSNNTSDDNIKMLLARKERERRLENANKFRNIANDKTLSKEQRDFARRQFDSEAEEVGRYTGYENEFAKRVGKDREVNDRHFEESLNDLGTDKQGKEFLRRANAMRDYENGTIGDRQYQGQMSGKYDKKTTFIPYERGSYTPGKYTEAQIYDQRDGYTTVLVPAELQPTKKQVQEWNKGKDIKVGDTVKAPYGIGNTYTPNEMHDFKVLKGGRYPVLEGKSKMEFTDKQVENFNNEFLKQEELKEKNKNKYDRKYNSMDEVIADKNSALNQYIRNKANEKKALTNAWNEYKKEHPGTTMTKNQFKKDIYKK